MAQSFSEYFICYARHHAATGLLVECNSDYNKYTLGGWYNMADFASDPRLRRQMTRLLDLYWADWAIEAARRRSRRQPAPLLSRFEFDGREQRARGGLVSLRPGTAMSQHPSVMCAATSGYRPLACVAESALDPAARGVYEYVCAAQGLRNRAPPETRR